MCGIIAGVAVIGSRTKITNKGTYDRAKMLTERLNHRGPDDIGVHIGDSFWMGHTRLSIVDPSHGHQPLMNREKTRYELDMINQLIWVSQQTSWSRTTSM